MKDKVSYEFSFKKPAIYKIKVLGDLGESWSERLGGMQINVERSQDKSPVSVLIGQINDQSALSGVLNTLYELHLTIMSVNVLKDEIY
jgi:hypothetical protein